jgi:pantetheine-phosphate adenylyltransferase
VSPKKSSARIAIYAGSFDPPTEGHLDVINRVLPLFDTVYVVVASNIRKSYLFDAEERAELLDTAIAHKTKAKNYEVKIHSGLLMDLCEKLGAQVLVRGLRALSDFEYEFQMSVMNKRINPTVETLHIMTDERFLFISSTTIKEIAFHKGPLKDLVPPNVEKALKKKVRLSP